MTRLVRWVPARVGAGACPAEGVSTMALRSLLRAFLVVPLVAVSALVATAAPPLAPVAGAATESCATPATSAPTGPATVSAASTADGQVLFVGSRATPGGPLSLLRSSPFPPLPAAAPCPHP